MDKQISKESLQKLKVVELKKKAGEFKTDISGLKRKSEIIDAILLDQNILEPNIVFVGRRKALNPETNQFEMTEKEVPKAVSVPSKKITLPPDIQHGKPFYHTDADLLKTNLPNDFKTPKDLGAK